MAIDSIWNNDFYQRPPVPTWLFELDFKQFFIDPESQDLYADILTKAVISCSWNERSITSIPVYYAGVEGKLPGRVANSGELDIKFNENSDFIITKILEKIFHADSMCDAYFTDKGAYSYNKEFNKNRKIRLILLRPENAQYIIDPQTSNGNHRAVIIEYNNCWLSKLSSQEFSYEVDEETITRTATFTYDYFRVFYNGEVQQEDSCYKEI
jgi:hypothetical protein